MKKKALRVVTSKKKRLLNKNPVEDLLKRHILFVPDDISASSCAQLLKELIAIATSRCRRDVHLFVCSSGGQVDISRALVEVLLAMPQKVVTYGIGTVCSAALTIFLAGKERITLPSTIFLLHQFSWGEAHVKYHELVGRREIEDTVYKLTEEYYYARTRSDLVRVLCREKTDKWFTGKQAFTWNIATKLVDHLTIPQV